MNIVIDNEFKALIPPLSSEERAQLEENLIADGCRDPLVVWPLPEFTEEDTGITFRYADYRIEEFEIADGEWRPEKVWDAPDGGESYHLDMWPCILIDGHNRHEICTRLDIPFDVTEMEFADRDAAMDWMDANQLGRRNLTRDQFSLLIGRRYNRTKKTRAEAGAIGGSSKDQNDTCLPNTADRLADEHGVSPATVKRAGRFAEEVERTPELQDAIQSGRPVLQVKRELKEQKREERREENRAKVAEVAAPAQIIETGAKFATIAIDPPWDWGDEGDQDQLGRARPDYSTMSINQLMDLPIPDLADDDCHIYLWITNRSLPKGFDLLEKWGFRYITAITWVKPHFGMGNYFRGQTEHILFGVKGSQMLRRKDVGTVFNAARGPNGHSSKPVEFYDLVESCSPGPYLEMFSRTDREDWTAWGENANASN